MASLAVRLGKLGSNYPWSKVASGQRRDQPMSLRNPSSFTTPSPFTSNAFHSGSTLPSAPPPHASSSFKNGRMEGESPLGGSKRRVGGGGPGLNKRSSTYGIPPEPVAYCAAKDIPAHGKASALEQVAIHVKSSRNNTILTLSDAGTGNVLNWASCGSAGLKKAARGSSDAGFLAATLLIKKAKDLIGTGVQPKIAHLKLAGFGPGREMASRAIISATDTFRVTRISDVTPIRFGGCRPKKPRRL